jgi:hypothetical protein
MCHRSPSQPQDAHLAAGVMSVGIGPFSEVENWGGRGGLMYPRQIVRRREIGGLYGRSVRRA